MVFLRGQNYKGFAGLKLRNASRGPIVFNIDVNNWLL
jgi:hypothetical protein